MTMAERIKWLRESHGLTQAELGVITGVSDKAVSTWESGKREPRMGAIQKMADYYHITKSAIIEGPLENEDAQTVNNDPELTEYLEELRTRPEQRMLLSVTKDATKEEVEAVVNFITSLRRGKNND